MTESQTRILSAIKNWLEQFVIGHNLCPFAKKPFVQDSIRFSFFDLENNPQVFLEELELLNQNEDIETTLLLIETGAEDFFHFLDIVDQCQLTLENAGLEGVYQIASFHPDYLFEGEPTRDESHYTNRSPVPILHIIREASIERVLASYPDPDSIPENNITLMRSLGHKVLEAQLKGFTNS